jgi:tape measure domain-containing protein
MNEYRLAIVIDANGRPAIEVINKVTGASRTLEGAQRGAAGGADRLAQSSKRTEGELQTLGATARRVQGFLAAVFGAAVVRDIINTTTRIDGMKRTLEGVLGSGQAAAAGIAFIRSEADRLGVAFQPALDGYTKLAAAARGTSLAPQINELTGSILQAGSAFNLSGDQIGGAIQAIEQMISKGTVSAEELRGQLGERIPGAFGIAAQAMGVTTAELSKMLEKGDVVATDFLPKFAAELQRSTAAASALNAASPSAELERIKNELEGIATDIGGGIFEGLGDGLSEFKEALAGINARDLGRDIGEAIGAIVRNIDIGVAAMVAFAGARGIGAAVVALQGLGLVARAVPPGIAAAGAAFMALNVPVVGNTAAITAWTRAAGLATTVGRGLFALIGGWPGLLAAAAGGVYYLSTAQSAAERTADALRESVDRLNGATREQQPAFAIATRAKLEDARASLAAARANMALYEAQLRAAQSNTGTSRGSLEIRSGQTFQAMRGIEAAQRDMAALTQLVNEAGAALDRIDGKGGNFWKSFNQAISVKDGLKALGIELGKTEGALGSAGDAAGDLAKETQKYIESLSEQIATLGMSRAEQVRWEAAQRASKAATQDQSAEILRLGEALARKIEETEAATEAEREATQAAADLESANERLEAAYSALIDPLRNVADAQRAFTQLQADLFRELGGPRAQIMAQYKEDLRVIQEYLASAFAAGPITPDQARQVEDQVRRAREDAERARDEELRTLARDAGKDFEDVFRRALEDGINGANLQSFWQTITDGFKRAIEEGGAQGALNFVAGATDMLSQAVGTYQQAGGGARGVSAAVANMNIPYVSPIASILNSIDSLFGGRLFGTDWATQGASRQFAIGSGGETSGTYSERQSRQRSLFRGTSRRTRSTELEGDELNAINELMRGAQQALASAARAVGAEVPELLAFGFRQEFDSKGNLIRETATIAGQQFSESLEEAAQRYIGANILTLLGALDPALAALADRFDATGSEVLDFAQAMLAAQADIQRGAGLILGATVSEIGEAIESLRVPGESLIETYARVSASTDLYLSALGLMDGAMQASTSEVVAFAAGAVEAMGGLDAAAQQLNVILGEFFTDAERAAFRLQEAQTRATQAQIDLGVNGVTADNYRTRFEAARQGGLTPEQFAQWVRLGVAIAEASAASRDLAAANEALAESTGVVADVVGDTSAAMAEASERMKEALRQLAEFDTNLGAELTQFGRDGMNEFVAGVQDVESWIRQSTEEAQRLAQAAGFAAASEETLTQIRLLGAARVGQAIAALDAQTVQLISSMYAAADATAEIDLSRSNSPLAFAQQLANGFREIADEIDPQRYQQALQIAQNLFNLGWAAGNDPLNIAERMGLPFDRFVADLGVDLRALGEVANFDGLVQAARALGVELPDLATRLGVSLGLLSDAGSLLNDGFERVLGQMSATQREPIEALLRQLETAPASDRAALTAMIAQLVNALPAELRAQLAPYLDDVDLTPPEQEQISATDRVTTAVNAGNTLLGQILGAIERNAPGSRNAPDPDNPLPGEKSAERGGLDVRPVVLAVDTASMRQVAELQSIAKGIRSVEGAVMRSNTLLSEIANESRRESERRSTVGVA